MGNELLLPLVDEENTCLPLPINVVSRYWNVVLPMAEAVEIAKKYPGFEGSVIIEGIESAERHGLACRIASSSISKLKGVIDSGVPPIVILPGIPEFTQHASVITGYDSEEGTILHYIQKGNKEGEQQEGAIPQDVFEKEWSEDGRIMIVICPPDIMSSLEFRDSESNRLCFVAERSSILNNISDALGLLSRAVEIDPKNSTALYLTGSMMSMQGSPDCVGFYERCLDANPKSYLGWNGLGNFYLRTGNLEKAEDCYDRAIRINPKRSAKIYKNRAHIRQKQNRNSDAKGDLKNYLKYLPSAADRGVIEKIIREM